MTYGSNDPQRFPPDDDSQSRPDESYAGEPDTPDRQGWTPAPPPSSDSWGQSPPPHNPFASSNPYPPSGQPQPSQPQWNQQEGHPGYGQPPSHPPYGDSQGYPPYPPQQQGWGPSHGYPPHGGTPPPSGKSLPALIFGVLSLLFGLCCIPLGLAFGVVGIILAANVQKERRRWDAPSDPTATAALVLSIVGIALTLINLVVSLYIQTHPELLQGLIEMLQRELSP